MFRHYLCLNNLFWICSCHLDSNGDFLMSNYFSDLARERAFEGYIESKDYQNDLIEAAEKWIEKDKANRIGAEQILLEKLAEYDLSPLLLRTDNTIIEDARRETLLEIGEAHCEEDVIERFYEEPCYDY
jgi:hypothetical protein